jgi:hypothetical protein
MQSKKFAPGMGQLLGMIQTKLNDSLFRFVVAARGSEEDLAETVKFYPEWWLLHHGG